MRACSSELWALQSDSRLTQNAYSVTGGGGFQLSCSQEPHLEPETIPPQLQLQLHSSADSVIDINRQTAPLTDVAQKAGRGKRLQLR